MSVTYEVELSDYMHDELRDFLLAQTPAWRITLFEGGAIMQDDEPSAVVVQVDARAIAEALALSELPTALAALDLDELEAVIRERVGCACARALRALDGGAWYLVDDDRFDEMLYPGEAPSLVYTLIQSGNVD